MKNYSSCFILEKAVMLSEAPPMTIRSQFSPIFSLLVCTADNRLASQCWGTLIAAPLLRRPSRCLTPHLPHPVNDENVLPYSRCSFPSPSPSPALSRHISTLFASPTKTPPSPHRLQFLYIFLSHPPHHQSANPVIIPSRYNEAPPYHLFHRHRPRRHGLPLRRQPLPLLRSQPLLRGTPHRRNRHQLPRQ